MALQELSVHLTSQPIHLPIHLLMDSFIHLSTWVAGTPCAQRTAVSEGKACLSVSGCWRVREPLMQAEAQAWFQLSPGPCPPSPVPWWAVAPCLYILSQVGCWLQPHCPFSPQHIGGGQ